MAKLNLTKLAVKVCELEGKKQQVNVAQVKEVVNCLFDHLYSLNNEDSGEIMASLFASAKKRMEKKNNALLRSKIRAMKSKK